MKPSESISKWHDLLKAAPLNEDLKDALSLYIRSIIKSGFPVILNVEHLSHLVRIEYIFLKRMMNSSESFYYEFEIPKRRGGKRVIEKPYPTLILVQKWILRHILQKKAVHRSAFGFVKGKSMIDNAKCHINGKSLLTIDLKDFFPNIKLPRVISLFQRIGYPYHISYILASLCVKNGRLPQGAPTSPYISNLVTHKLDSRLDKLCDKFDICYTRYADDMAFSGGTINLTFVNLVRSIIADEGFIVNEGKVKLIHGFDKRKIITGVSISSKKTTIPKSTKRKWKLELFYLIKNGLDAQMKVLRINDPLYLDRCIGKLNFWLQVEPDNKFARASLDTVTEMKKLRSIE
ncbi:MAG: RNA-directed DNA polymerase [Saprospiraceae bacterium]|nr:RNA-directed DNA polymerase [Saprospiraceae bacterium]